MQSPWSTYVQDTKMNTHEREELRARLLSYMEYHPYREHISKQVPFMERFMQHVGVLRAVASGSVAALVLIIATPFLAEGANPGDLLYAVKTRVNEPLQGITLSTPEEKIAFKTKLLEKRVLEAKLLVENNSMSPEAEADLSKNIKRHSEEIQENIEVIATTNEEGALYAKADLAAELTKTSEIVEAIVSEKPADSLKKAVAAVKDDAVESAAIATISSQDQVAGHIERELSRAYELRATLNGKLTAEEEAEIARRFTRIETILRGKPVESVAVMISEAKVTTSTVTSEGGATSTESEAVLLSTTTMASTTLSKPTSGPEDVLTRIKTLITYLTNAALREAVPKEPVVVEIIPDSKPATSTQATTTANTEATE
ncbi:hypothetical protein A3C87_00850 [Candidatus Kaiserbacteria bacterium RIFCSPHIGHO2_02_FULL_49_34]|uniref:Uncharacterized protein n=1 Tax=Candidatus Kaiserbacteria bacterium RIFCSPHIGHO2_02_FULL_49_34 TaxID=1798491 RepID=A0A1F6DKG3_9BACT|nr:MAG: hypothetical protein A3C87_00850 [Candidatus Kaiserbacteria bacterium RIFCSPHIGHO2_02_FULL_49_34]